MRKTNLNSQQAQCKQLLDLLKSDHSLANQAGFSQPSTALSGTSLSLTSVHSSVPWILDRTGVPPITCFAHFLSSCLPWLLLINVQLPNGSSVPISHILLLTMSTGEGRMQDGSKEEGELNKQLWSIAKGVRAPWCPPLLRLRAGRIVAAKERDRAKA